MAARVASRTQSTVPRPSRGARPGAPSAAAKLVAATQRRRARRLPATPDPMEGLAYDEESGELIDQETGKPLKALNENGATRFDVAVRAMRGEFDRPGVEPEQDTEEAAASSGAILDALVHFPAPYTFQVVGPKGGAAGPEDISAFEEDVVACIARVLSAPPEMLEVSSKERSGGKYLSVSVVGTVSSPLLLDHVFSALDEMDRVMMRF